MKDTTVQAEKLFRRLMRAKSPAERLAMACGMFSTARALFRAGIQREENAGEPGRTREKMFLRFYGGDFGESDREKIRRHIRTG